MKRMSVAFVFFAILGMMAGSSRAAADSSALDQLETLRMKDHPQFVQRLAELHRVPPAFSERDKWRLYYLDAWETLFEGDYPKAESKLHDIIDHSGDVVLSVKASSLLLNSYAANRHYEQGFALANRLSAELPQITDSDARYFLLLNLSTILNMAGQTDLAVTYADMMASVIPAGDTPCLSMYLRAAALANAKKLSASSVDIPRTINICTKAHQSVIANAMSLAWGDLYIDEHQAAKSLEVLGRIAESVRKNNYYPHMLSILAQQSRAYEALGKDDDARKAALAAIAVATPDDVSEWLATAYGVLYRVEKKKGDAVAALNYYERYVEKNRDNLTDVSAKTTAYELSRQNTLVQQLKAESLGNQNRVLRLQKVLDAKAAETARLYIAVLLVIAVAIALVAIRLKRSQLRYRKLAHSDGLTGIHHHQHFMSEAENCLRALEKQKEGACLLSIDMDHFKRVNDTYGHAVGDAVLRHAVLVCQHKLRPHDLFGRLGGEEFGILLTHCGRGEGMAVAERIRAAIEASPLMEDGTTVALSASMGLACTGLSGYTLKQLCRDSDAALYRAKRSGRNRVVAHADLDDQATGGIPGSNLSNVTG